MVGNPPVGKTAFAICCAADALLPLQACGLGGQVVIITGHGAGGERLVTLTTTNNRGPAVLLQQRALGMFTTCCSHAEVHPSRSVCVCIRQPKRSMPSIGTRSAHRNTTTDYLQLPASTSTAIVQDELLDVWKFRLSLFV